MPRRIVHRILAVSRAIVHDALTRKRELPSNTRAEYESRSKVRIIFGRMVASHIELRRLETIFHRIDTRRALRDIADVIARVARNRSEKVNAINLSSRRIASVLAPERDARPRERMRIQIA
jgi:hypothetical protein